MKRLSVVLLLILVLSFGCIYLPESAGTSITGQSPTITRFDADPDTISAGDRSQLSWEVKGATSVTIDNGIGSVALQGNRTVIPSETVNYTLTATNQYGTASATAKVLVSGTGGGTTPPSGAPVINSFIASPDTVTAGGSSVLSWNVSNATTVSISPLIGSVAPVAGSGTVTVGSTTVFVMTATNAAGSVSSSVTVTVASSPPPAGKPDLVIQSITKVETSGGYIIGFKVKNMGPAASGASIARLFAEGIQKSNANVPALAAGSTYDGTFADWIYSPFTPHLKVMADASGIISEADETNNEKSVTMAISIVYDFVAQANSPSADVSWKSGAGNLTFGGALNDSKGFVAYRTNVTLEDNHIYDKVLETHPEWVDDGYISGTYLELFNTYAYRVKAGEHFYARCGFIKNAAAGKVKYSVMIRCEGGPNTWIVEDVKAYNGALKVINVDLTPYAGKKADFILRVSAEGSSSQDWAVWEQARIIR